MEKLQEQYDNQGVYEHRGLHDLKKAVRPSDPKEMEDAPRSERQPDHVSGDQGGKTAIYISEDDLKTQDEDDFERYFSKSDDENGGA